MDASAKVVNAALHKIEQARLRLLRDGHTPLPLEGWKVVLPNWTQVKIDEPEVRSWTRRFPSATNTGIATPSLRVQVLDKHALAAIEDCVRQRYGNNLAFFFSLRQLIVPFRSPVPLRSISIPLLDEKSAVDELSNPRNQQKLELSGKDRYVLAHGTYPSNPPVPIDWLYMGATRLEPREPIPHDDLPELRDQAEAQALLDELAEIGKPYGLRPATPEKTTPADQPLPLIFAEDFSEDVRKDWVVKGVIARGEISSWIGPPKGAKSATLLDLTMHIVSGRDWRGYRNKGTCGVVYFALERHDLVRRRSIAYRRRDELPKNIPFAICPKLIDLMDEKCVEAIVKAVKDAEHRLGTATGLLIFDSYSKGIAAGGGKEDKADDQNKVSANMRLVLERLEHKVHITGIGHTGKDESKGERGSNARLADVDALLTVFGSSSNDKAKIVTTEQGNDQPLGPLTAIELEAFDFDPDEDGEAVRTYIVSRTEPATANPKDGGRQKLNDKQRRALQALAEAVLNFGEDCAFAAPPARKAVTHDQWKNELLTQRILEPDKRPDRQLERLRDQLASRHLIGIKNDFVWLATTS